MRNKCKRSASLEGGTSVYLRLGFQEGGKYKPIQLILRDVLFNFVGFAWRQRSISDEAVSEKYGNHEMVLIMSPHTMDLGSILNNQQSPLWQLNLKKKAEYS